MKAGKALTAVGAAIVAIAAIGLVFGGGALLWAYGTQRDADGFLTSPGYELVSSGYALTSTDISLAANPGDWLPTDLGEVRLEVEPSEGSAVFVGIGPADEVDGYLASVARDEVTRVDGREVTYRSIAGGAPPTPPGDQTFWVVSTEGPGVQTVIWDLARGDWTVVVMSPDGSDGVSATLQAGARIDLLPGIAIGLFAGGIVLAGLAAALLVWATRREVDVAGEAPVVGASTYGGVAGPYPVSVEGTLDPGLSRWMWLVKWLLAIPHYVVLGFLWVAFAVLTVVAFFAILFTGRYPRAIFDFNVGVLRWTWRVGFYATHVLGSDRYPPFTLAETDYPSHFDVAYPERLSRGLVLVKWWLLAIPHYLIVGLFTSGLIWWTTEVGGDAVLQIGGGLIGVLVVVAALVLAFTGHYPGSIFDLVMGLNRWVFRVVAYVALMRDEYPPFRLDQGGSESVGYGGTPGGPPAGDRAVVTSTV